MMSAETLVKDLSMLHPARDMEAHKTQEWSKIRVVWWDEPSKGLLTHSLIPIIRIGLGYPVPHKA